MRPASEVVVMVVTVVVAARKVAPDSRVKVHVHSSSCDLVQESDDALEMKGSPYFVHSSKMTISVALLVPVSCCGVLSAAYSKSVLARPGDEYPFSFTVATL